MNRLRGSCIGCTEESNDEDWRGALPHPGPLPQGEGELSSDSLTRRAVAVVQGFRGSMRESFAGNLTPALSPIGLRYAPSRRGRGGRRCV
jgi:hypothetical protein